MYGSGSPVSREGLVVSMSRDRQLVRAGRETLFDRNILDVVWRITDRCNLACSYCHARTSPSGSFAETGLFTRALGILKHLDRDEISFALTGGEPTMHPDFGDLLTAIAEQFPSSRVRFLTNLCRDLRFFEALGQWMPLDRLSVLCSIHLESIHLELALTRIAHLARMGFGLSVSIIAHPLMMSTVRDLHLALSELSSELEFTVHAIPVTEPNSANTRYDRRYASDDLAWLRLHSGLRPRANRSENSMMLEYECTGEDPRRLEYVEYREMVFRNLNRFRGMLCDIGLNSLLIGPDGSVQRALCMESIDPHPVANIYRQDTPTEHLRRPIVCPFEYCTCATYAAVPKYRRPELGPTYRRCSETLQASPTRPAIC